MLSFWKGEMLFTKILTSYIIILLFPLAIGSILYFQAINIIEKETVENNQIVLENTKSIIDSYIISTKNIVNNIAADSRIIDMSRSKGKLVDNNLYNTFVTKRDYSVIDKHNDFLLTYYILFKNSNSVLTQESVYTDSELFYHHYINSNGTGYQEWFKRMTEEKYYYEYTQGTYQFANDIKKPVIFMLQSIPVGTISKPQASIALVLDENKIRQFIEPISTQKGGWYFVLQRDGNIISSSNDVTYNIDSVQSYMVKERGIDSIEINGKKMLLTYETSNETNWKYITLIPYDNVVVGANRIRDISLVILLAILFIGLFMAFLAAYQSNKPIKKILNLFFSASEIETENTSKNAYIILEEGLEKLLDNKKSLSLAVKEQATLLEGEFFQRLIKGQFKNMLVLQSMGSVLGISFIDGKHIIILIKVTELNEEASKKELNVEDLVLAKRIITRYTVDNGFVHKTENNEIMLMLSFSNLDNQSIYDLVKNIVEDLKYELFVLLKIKLTFGVGEIYENLMSVNKSFNEAKRCIEQHPENIVKDVIWYKDVQWDTLEFYFPLDLQLKLFYIVRASNVKGLAELLDEIYNENYVKRKLSGDMENLLHNDMFTTYLKIKSKLKLIEDKEENVFSFEKSGGLKAREWFDALYKRFENLCNFALQQKSNLNKLQINEVMDFIRKNFWDSQLSLTMVADKFGYSEVHLSVLIKESIGENYSDYVERLRIEKACMMLEKGDVAIKMLSSMVGYNSDNSFRRAFKRLKFVSPTMYQNDISTKKIGFKFEHNESVINFNDEKAAEEVGAIKG